MSATQDDVDALRELVSRPYPKWVVYSETPFMKLFHKNMEEAMSKKTDREKIIGELVTEMEAVLDKHKAYLDEERRHFHQMTGARDVLSKLWTLGVIHPDYEEMIGAWMKEGGYAVLTIDGINITKGSE